MLVVLLCHGRDLRSMWRDVSGVSSEGENRNVRYNAREDQFLSVVNRPTVSKTKGFLLDLAPRLGFVTCRVVYR
jgi:hypothetical protein